MSPLRPAGAPRASSRARAWLLDVMMGAALVALLLAVTATAPRWSRFLREAVPEAPDEGGAREERGPAPTPPPAEVRRTINVKLFFESPDGGGLVIEERTVPFSGNLAHQIETVAGALVAGSQGGLLAPVPPETRVLGAFVSSDGVAYLNLSQEALADFPGGSRSELLAVYSLVDSIAANFPAVRRVQILVDDRPAETLAGHVDLSRPLPPDMSLLAPSPVTPLAPSGGELSPGSAPGGGGR